MNALSCYYIIILLYYYIIILLYDGKRFHFSETLGVPFDELGPHGERGSGGEGGKSAQRPGRRIL